MLGPSGNDPSPPEIVSVIVNVICPSGGYGTVISQAGSGYSWSEHATFNRLTRWEQDLRNLNAPGSAYRNSFTGHYLWVLPHSVLTRLVPALMGGAFLAAPLWRWTDRNCGLTSGPGRLR